MDKDASRDAINDGGTHLYPPSSAKTRNRMQTVCSILDLRNYETGKSISVVCEHERMRKRADDVDIQTGK